jgi:hypothetical protein
VGTTEPKATAVTLVRAMSAVMRERGDAVPDRGVRLGDLDAAPPARFHDAGAPLLFSLEVGLHS